MGNYGNPDCTKCGSMDVRVRHASTSTFTYECASCKHSWKEGPFATF